MTVSQSAKVSRSSDSTSLRPNISRNGLLVRRKSSGDPMLIESLPKPTRLQLRGTTNRTEEQFCLSSTQALARTSTTLPLQGERARSLPASPGMSASRPRRFVASANRSGLSLCTGSFFNATSASWPGMEFKALVCVSPLDMPSTPVDVRSTKRSHNRQSNNSPSPRACASSHDDAAASIFSKVSAGELINSSAMRRSVSAFLYFSRAHSSCDQSFDAQSPAAAAASRPSSARSGSPAHSARQSSPLRKSAVTASSLAFATSCASGIPANLRSSPPTNLGPELQIWKPVCSGGRICHSGRRARIAFKSTAPFLPMSRPSRSIAPRISNRHRSITRLASAPSRNTRCGGPSRRRRKMVCRFFRANSFHLAPMSRYTSTPEPARNNSALGVSISMSAAA